MKYKIGKKYRTYGGWEAIVIWICRYKYNGFYAIHKPGTDDESCCIIHWEDGTAHGLLSVHEPPVFDKQHLPADLINVGKDK